MSLRPAHVAWTTLRELRELQHTQKTICRMGPVRPIWYESNLPLVQHRMMRIPWKWPIIAEIIIITTMERTKTLPQVVQRSERFHIQPVVPASSDEMLSVSLLLLTFDNQFRIPEHASIARNEKGRSVWRVAQQHLKRS